VTDRLPNRGFTELPAPDRGLAVAIAHGRRLRHRRQAAHAGLAGLLVVATIGTGAWLTTASHEASDHLVPAGPGPQATAAADARPARPAATALGVTPAAPADAALAPQPSGDQPGRTAPGSSASPPPRSSPGRPASAYRTPALKRTYTAPDPTGARLCSAQVTDDSSGTRKRIDWCIQPTAALSEAGHDLAVTVCRDQAGDAKLSFSTSREVELQVRRGTRIVWRWSVGQPETDRPHVLDTPAGACWTWTAPWTDVDGSGRALPSGSYELVATSRANEVAELPEESTTFRLD
jgi:hypothetical protein